MKLNCKVGDLAIVVRSVIGNTGKIVRCLRLHPAMCDVNGDRDQQTWEIDQAIGILENGEKCALFSDRNLRPIRDQPGEDETLTWVGLPAGHKVTA